MQLGTRVVVLKAREGTLPRNTNRRSLGRVRVDRFDKAFIELVRIPASMELRGVISHAGFTGGARTVHPRMVRQAHHART